MLLSEVQDEHLAEEVQSAEVGRGGLAADWCTSADWFWGGINIRKRLTMWDNSVDARAMIAGNESETRVRMAVASASCLGHQKVG